jgi:hypothetical protein
MAEVSDVNKSVDKAVYTESFQDCHPASNKYGTYSYLNHYLYHAALSMPVGICFIKTRNRSFYEFPSVVVLC